jgi:hypothetical protein
MADEAAVPEETVESILEEISPKSEIKHWLFQEPDGAIVGQFTQKPLSFIGKLEFFGVLGAALEKAMQSGMTVDGIMEMGGAAVGGGEGIDGFVSAIARIAQYAPDLITQTYCIALGVPRGYREGITEFWEQNLSDNDGFEILEIFIAQNGDALRDFFTKGSKLGTLIQKVAPQDAASPSSKPSKPTRATTRRQ